MSTAPDTAKPGQVAEARKANANHTTGYPPTPDGRLTCTWQMGTDTLIAPTRCGNT